MTPSSPAAPPPAGGARAGEHVAPLGLGGHRVLATDEGRAPSPRRLLRRERLQRPFQMPPEVAHRLGGKGQLRSVVARHDPPRDPVRFDPTGAQQAPRLAVSPPRPCLIVRGRLLTRPPSAVGARAPPLRGVRLDRIDRPPAPGAVVEGGQGGDCQPAGSSRTIEVGRPARSSSAT